MFIVERDAFKLPVINRRSVSETGGYNNAKLGAHLYFYLLIVSL
jgi:hypothetical protein